MTTPDSFRDLNKNGRLDPCEDPSRAKDLARVYSAKKNDPPLLL